MGGDRTQKGNNKPRKGTNHDTPGRPANARTYARSHSDLSAAPRQARCCGGHQYTFDPGSELIESDSTVLPVSGKFTFDTTDDSVTSGAITISGPSPFPLTSTLLQQLFLGGAVDLQAFFNHDFAQSFVLSFTPALGTTGALQGTLTATTPAFPVDLASFSGSVTSTAVPEPRTWAMMLLGLAALSLLMKWRPRLPLARTDPQATPG